MPMLLEDLAEETSASDRRVAERFDAENRDLDEFLRSETDLKNRRQRIARSAQFALEFGLLILPRYESLWHAALGVLRELGTSDRSIPFLRDFQRVLESGQRLIGSCRTLCGRASEIGLVLDRLEELERADSWFQGRVAETKKAIEHRIHPWQPSDPERFALGLKLAREGKTISSDEVLARFRRAGN